MVNATRFRAAHEADWERLDTARHARSRSAACAACPNRRLLALPRALPLDAVVAVGRARDLARPARWSPISSSSARAPISRSTACRPRRWRQLGHFFARGWPEAVQALWRETLVAFVLTAAGAIVALSAGAQRPELVLRADPRRHGGRAAIRPRSAQSLRSTLYDGGSDASRARWRCSRPFLFTHNAQIAIFVVRAGLRLLRADRAADRL